MLLPDYTYYARDYGGELPENEFRRYVKRAGYTASHCTLGRSENPPEEMEERVRDCICALTDAGYSYNKSAEMLPPGIGSVSNDGYSVSRGTETAGDEYREYEAICRKYLLAPVNLMAAGVRVGGYEYVRFF